MTVQPTQEDFDNVEHHKDLEQNIRGVERQISELRAEVGSLRKAQQQYENSVRRVHIWEREQRRHARNEIEDEKADWARATLKPGDYVKMSGCRDTGYRKVLSADKGDLFLQKIHVSRGHIHERTETTTQSPGKISQIYRAGVWVSVLDIMKEKR